MVIWLIGLSGSGKSTIAKILYEKIKKKYPNTVWLDGDEVRKIYNDKLGYTLSDREKNAERLSKISKFIYDQKINFIRQCCQFSKWQKWNKKKINNYRTNFCKSISLNLIFRDEKSL